MGGIPDSKLQVSGHDTVLLVIACGIACEFEDLSSKVFKDGSEVHWSVISQLSKRY